MHWGGGMEFPWKSYDTPKKKSHSLKFHGVLTVTPLLYLGFGFAFAHAGEAEIALRNGRQAGRPG